jgi:hypothetical protein
MFLKIMTLFILLTNLSHARKPSSIEYKCDLQWNVFSEPTIKKTISYRELIEVEIKNNLKVILETTNEQRKISLIENYEKEGDVLKYQFQCDRYFNCSGYKQTTISKKVTKKNLDISPTGNIITASFKGRSLFTYHNKNETAFNLQYILYKLDNEAEPMGLKVNCDEP